MALTVVAVKNAKPMNRPYKIGDSGGLFLKIEPSGRKYWRFKYRYGGKEKLLALGVFPLIDLAEARSRRDDARKLLSLGQDPATVKKEVKGQTIHNAENTFKVLALEWIEVQKGHWSPRYGDCVLKRLENDIFAVLGSRPASGIEPVDLLNCLRRVEARGAYDIAGRLRQICGQIFRFGIATGRCKRDPSRDLQGALRVHKTKHFAALDPKEIPELLAALKTNDARLYPRTRRAIWFSLLTFARPGEVRQAEWSEVDFKNRQWVIPAEKMKMKKDHMVPLAPQAIQILKEQREETELLKTDYVFPSQIRPKEPMSNNTVRSALRKLGFKNRMVAHGFRALARSAIRERLHYPADIIEVQLAHTPSGALGSAYDRATFLEQRRKMMTKWADYIDGLSETKKETKQKRAGAKKK